MKSNKGKHSNKVEKEERPPKKRQRKTNKKNPIIKFINRALISIIILIIAVFCTLTYINGWGLKGALMTLFNVNAKKINNLETINVVLLGVSEDLDSRLTDTIMLCSYNPKTSNVSMLSIPRDTFIGDSPENASSSDKINTLFYKNNERFLKKVSDIIGRKVKYYAVLNNQSIIEIVDIIGGIYFDVPIDMNYDDPTQDLHIHLTKGEQLIDGEKAEQLLRFRHNNDGTSYPKEYGDNDYGRMKTQRAFIEATIRQVISFKNILNCTNIYRAVINNIDTNYDFKDIKNYIPTLVDFKIENINSKQLPGKSVKYNDIWFFTQDKDKTKEIVKELEIN